MLFLGAGSVIHAMHHEQDMRNYGGLRKKIPLTFGAMMIGTLAITGVGIPLTGWFGFAGFVSKDAIIESAFVGSHFAFWMLVIAAFMTSFYSWRLMFLTFYGAPRGDHHAHDHAHESPKVMLIPLGVLALGATFSGMLWYSSFFGDLDKEHSWFGMEVAQHEAAGEGEGNNTTEHATDTHAATTETHAAPAAEAHGDMVHAAPKGAIFFGPDNHTIHEAHLSPVWVKVSPFIAMLLGFALAWKFYIRSPELPAKLAKQQRPLYLFLLNKWYFDELYDVIFVRPAKWLGAVLWKKGDGSVIDGSINGIAMGIIPMLTRLAGRVQSGYIFHYAFAMVVGIVVLVTWMTLSGGAH
jgi:NADH-quinone oxidoreductase subunit L